MQPTDCHSSRVMTDLYFWLPSERRAYIHAEIGLSRCIRFSEFYYCCRSSLLPQLACSIHATWSIDFSRSLYIAIHI